MAENNRLSGNFNSGILLPALLVFFACYIIVSYWLGYIFLSTPLNIAIAAIAAFLLLRRFPIRMPLPKPALAIALVVFAMAAYSLFFITPFYPASTDPAYLITIRALDGAGFDLGCVFGTSTGCTIPDTYAPYASLKFRYQLGHSLLARMFVDLLPVVPDYLVQWLLGAALAALEVLVLYALLAGLFGNRAALFSTVLFAASRPLFLDMYWGAHAMILGMVFALLFLHLFREKNPIAALAAPLPFMAHPGAAINGLLLFGAYLALNRNEIARALRILPALLLALPAFLTTYAVLAGNTLFPDAVMAAQATPAAKPPLVELIAGSAYYLPLWLGVLPAALLAASLIVFALKRNAVEIPEAKQNLGQKQNFEQKQNFNSNSNFRNFNFMLLLLAASVAAYFAFAAFQIPLTAKLVSLVAVSAVAISGAALSGMRISIGKTQISLSSAPVLALIFALGIAFFLNSSMLNELRSGNQITPEEARFAHALYQYDPSLQTTFFLSPGRLKMAELSNKIPFNPAGELFVPQSAYQAVHDSGWQELWERDAKWKEICGCGYIAAKEIVRTAEFQPERVQETGAKYLVVNADYFPEEIPFKKVLQQGSLSAYAVEG